MTLAEHEEKYTRRRRSGSGTDRPRSACRPTRRCRDSRTGWSGSWAWSVSCGRSAGGAP